MLHKMYEGTYPSLEDILRQNLFDLIINVPYDKQTTESARDQEVIREWAVKHDIPLMTDLATTTQLVKKLAKRLVVRAKKV